MKKDSSFQTILSTLFFAIVSFIASMVFIGCNPDLQQQTKSVAVFIFLGSLVLIVLSMFTMQIVIWRKSIETSLERSQEFKLMQQLYDLYNNIGNMSVDELDIYLREANVVELEDDILIGMLVASLPFKENVPYRSEFFHLVEETLSKRGTLEENLLNGLN